MAGLLEETTMRLSNLSREIGAEKFDEQRKAVGMHNSIYSLDFGF
jgi:hypothetical protein